MRESSVPRSRLARLSAITAAAVVVALGTATPAVAEGHVLGTANPTAIAGSYIVVLKNDAATAANGDPTAIRSHMKRLASEHAVNVRHTYEHALLGFAGTMTPTMARRLAAHPSVAYVHQNQMAQAVDTQPNPPSWGLDRVDQRYLPLDNGYSYGTTASNVRVYILDSGIRLSHTTFGGRASWGTNTIDGNNSDCFGHGTHVAGTVGGAQYGVAKAVALTAVKVLNCYGGGDSASITAGVDWVTGHHAPGAPAVANMSLRLFYPDPPLETAVRNSIADGVVYVVASGNENNDACNYAPARVPEAITVNATTLTDARASFSNWGTCTDIFAPGETILSAHHTSDTDTATKNGTSMAAPHVAGAAALILAGNPSLTPAQVATTLFNNATTNTVTDPGPNSPNRLLFIPNPPPPTAALNRYWWSGRDHISSVTYPGGSYIYEGNLGKILTGPVSGSHALYQCATGNDRFTSLQSNCEGRTYIGLLGYAYTAAPAAPHQRIYRCLIYGTTDHFDSADPGCEGQIFEGAQGYLLL